MGSAKSIDSATFSWPVITHYFDDARLLLGEWWDPSLMYSRPGGDVKFGHVSSASGRTFLFTPHRGPSQPNFVGVPTPQSQSSSDSQKRRPRWERNTRCPRDSPSRRYPPRPPRHSCHPIALPLVLHPTPLATLLSCVRGKCGPLREAIAASTQVIHK